MVKFSHGTTTEAYAPGEKLSGHDKKLTAPRRISHLTDCEILAGTIDCTREDQMLPAGKGRARVHLGDNFCKNVGRKISMLRAMKDFGLAKSDRKLFWDAYFKARNGKW